MQYRPTAGELLATIADLIENELLSALPAAHQHKARVAANLARILEREERLAPGAARDERERLGTLLGHDGEVADLSAELVARLRAGEGAQDAGFERAAWEALVAVARDDLAIAKPGHDRWEGE